MDLKDVLLDFGVPVTLFLGLWNTWQNLLATRKASFINNVTSQHVKWIEQLLLLGLLVGISGCDNTQSTNQKSHNLVEAKWVTIRDADKAKGDTQVDVAHIIKAGDSRHVWMREAFQPHQRAAASGKFISQLTSRLEFHCMKETVRSETAITEYEDGSRSEEGNFPEVPIPTDSLYYVVLKYTCDR